MTVKTATKPKNRKTKINKPKFIINPELSKLNIDQLVVPKMDQFKRIMEKPLWVDEK